jgi:hypothetical protein
MDIVSVFFLALILFWVAKIFFILQKSLNEITKALNCFDERLRNIERNSGRTAANPG